MPKFVTDHFKTIEMCKNVVKRFPFILIKDSKNV